jgi:lipoprotein NlpI
MTSRRSTARRSPTIRRRWNSTPSSPRLAAPAGAELHVRPQFDDSIRRLRPILDLNPDERPHHWQRGIALYYAGRFEDGTKQFELHRTVNPEDVENAAWHFLCLARWKDVETARKSLIPIKGDTRIPMAQVHRLFAGKATAEDVLKAAAADNPPPAQLTATSFTPTSTSASISNPSNNPKRPRST